KIDYEPNPAQEGAVNLVLAVRCQDRDAVELFHALQQIVDLYIGEAVMGILDFHSLAEKRVSLVEEQQNIGALAGVEYLAEILLGLTDVLAHYPSEVHAVDLHSQRARDDLCRHRLSGAARSCE